jgi:hypothetical protein
MSAGVFRAAALSAGLLLAFDAAVAQESGPTPAVAQSADKPLIVDRAFVVANGSMLQVRFAVPRAQTTRWVPVGEKETYAIEEASGEKFYVMKLVRIGPAAQVRMPKSGGSGYVIFDNRHERVKPGARITVVIGGLKQEHVLVEDR